MLPVEFIAFSADCTIHGRLSMFGDRLTDMLNGQARYVISRVRLESLADGHALESDSISLERSELCAVVATGPRGTEKRRRRLEQTRMQIGVGPYVILGHLHTEPGTDPTAGILKRDPMVPLTVATIAFTRAGALVAQDVPAIIVNRELVDWIVPAGDEAAQFPGASVRRLSTTYAKDFTGGAPL